EDAVAAMKLDASDYLKKPIDLDELLLNVEKVLNQEKISRQLEYSRKRESVSTEKVELLGDCDQIQKLIAQAQHIGSLCNDPEVLPPNILILGETGTGKDMAARMLHSISARKDKPFVHVDCASLPKDLIEAELFGHEKGAFTNAMEARTGLMEAAEDGVIFLDEIGELPIELQAKLLAVLERRTLRRVGSTQERPVPAWIISATNRNPEKMVEDGEMRSDLFFRLNVLSMVMPPLKNRGKDVLLLANHFAKQTASRYGLSEIKFSKDAEKALMEYPWPGNVRELKHLIERAVLLSTDGSINAETLMLNAHAESSGQSFDQDLLSLTLEEAEKVMLESALDRVDGNVSEAARQLGVTRMAMRYRMQKHNL
ncbi:MAG: sigma-54-dependent transcriptional regulator, partial [Gammaproteobacteria bacterium]